MKKLKKTQGQVKITVDKFSEIIADLVRLEEDWKDLVFPELTEVLRKWTQGTSIHIKTQKKIIYII